MELIEIDEWTKAHPGEYIFHIPTKQIGLCGRFDRQSDKITVIAGTQLITDTIKNFKKIKLNEQERKKRYQPKPSCRKCGK